MAVATMNQPEERHDPAFEANVLQDWVKLVIAMHEAKREAIDDFDRYEQALLRVMQRQGLKFVEFGRYTIRRVPIPKIACRTCGHDLPFAEPANLPLFTPERLRLTLRLTSTDKGATE